MRLFPLRTRPQTRRSPAVDLPRDEMAFRKQYEPLLLARAVTAVFRPGNRLYPAWRGYEPGEVVFARVIERVGSDARGIPPAFNDVRIPIRIDDVKVCAVAELAPEDFCGASPDVQDRRALARHLKEIYGRPLSAFGGIVSRIRFSFLDVCSSEAPGSGAFQSEGLSQNQAGESRVPWKIAPMS